MSPASLGPPSNLTFIHLSLTQKKPHWVTQPGIVPDLRLLEKSRGLSLPRRPSIPVVSLYLFLLSGVIWLYLWKKFWGEATESSQALIMPHLSEWLWTAPASQCSPRLALQVAEICEPMMKKIRLHTPKRKSTNDLMIMGLMSYEEIT